MGVKLRRCRGKPQRTPEHEAERVDMRGQMRRWPLKRFLEDFDLVIDNKRFDVPTTTAVRVHLKKQKMVAQLRAHTEGLQANSMKPIDTPRRRNLGGTVTSCAGTSNSHTVLWE